MKHIKKFEGFASDKMLKTLPMTTVNFLTNYYSCEECNALWKSFNKVDTECKFCKSDEIEDLSEEEWYEVVNSRLEPDEVKEMNKIREKEANQVVDLTLLKKDKKRYVN